MYKLCALALLSSSDHRKEQHPCAFRRGQACMTSQGLAASRPQTMLACSGTGHKEGSHEGPGQAGQVRRSSLGAGGCGGLAAHDCPAGLLRPRACPQVGLYTAADQHVWHMQAGIFAGTVAAVQHDVEDLGMFPVQLSGLAGQSS